ncbi:MAG TPA: prephenate dehydratase domain-containing protein [Chitinispirillaceae bacterium]|nr:prephenate dehydratase domain-containing protein [Chitinispirillaceae bacterium]
MKHIAALGPANTFSEIAAQMYVARTVPDSQIELFPTLKKVFSSVGKKCDIGILPIENMLEGYIPQVLDLLLHSRLTIIDELLVPVHFSFAANNNSIDEIKRVYVQFVTQGQCSDFIEQLPAHTEIITTESNGESLERIRMGSPFEGAVIPSHALKSYSFPLIINNINDYLENKTRFIVIAEQEQPFRNDLSYKTSIAILEGTDRPGMLSDMLLAFARRSINLLSIISRPTKESMGKYHFFIDIEGYARDKIIQEALTDVRKCGFVKLIGSYPKAEQPLIQGTTTIEKKRIPESPWNHKKQQQPVVHVVKGEDPYTNTIKALSTIDKEPIKGKKVLLKPNLGRIGPPESGIVTNPQVIAAAIDFFRDAGASLCAVGESPITGVDVIEAFKISGIEEVCRQRNCPLIDMDLRQPVEIHIPNAVALEKLRSFLNGCSCSAMTINLVLFSR